MNNRENPGILDNYPYRVILTRWLLAAVEAGLALYFAFDFKFELGLLLVLYGLISVGVLLPLIRCIRCSYYGKRCNFGWGVWVSKIFPKADDDIYSSTYGYTFVFWPLRIIPIGLGLLKLPSLFTDGFEFAPHGLFAAYLLVLFLHRKYYRAAACVKCRQRGVCPVYDINDIEREHR